ncbi:MAG: type II toxin-antitoxin system RatA family toxin [Alphaproteobacteria bacterium]
MPRHRETRIVPYSPEQMRNLVLDVEKYPEFLPWVTGLRVLNRKGPETTCEVSVGFKLLRERYSCVVDASDPDAVSVRYINGPMKYLNNVWKFSPGPGGRGCKIDFAIDFEFKNFLLQKTIGVVFGEAVALMVRSFDRRAERLYGRPPPAPPAKPDQDDPSDPPSDPETSINGTAPAAPGRQ